jgi:hypothetical protein
MQAHPEEKKSNKAIVCQTAAPDSSPVLEDFPAQLLPHKEDSDLSENTENESPIIREH